MAAERFTPIRLRPSWNTVRLGVVVAAMALAAINYQSNAAWLLTFLVCGVAAATVPRARRNLVGVEASAGEPGDCFAGEPLAIEVVLRNRGAQAAWSVEPTADVALVSPTPAVGLPPGGEARTTLLLAPRKRGRCRVAGLRPTSSFPFGLVQAVGARSDLDLVVYPRPEGVALDGAPRPAPIDAQGDGARAGDDFAGHRRHVPGDSQRHVDWKAVARGRPLLVKAYHGGGGEGWLRWQDTSGDGEQRLSQLARWVIEAEAGGWRYGLSLPGIDLDPDAGPAHRARCLRALALQVVA
jgi:uncharacterized protein (DUF58 family)